VEFQTMPMPWPATEADPQPDVRAGLEEAGFRLLGAQVRVLPTDAQVAALAADYTPADGAELLRNDGPAQVMAAPDGSAFVRMAWFWSGTYAEMSTVRPCGRVVTTALDWGVDPAWPRALRRSYTASTDSRREQVLWWAPSASLRIVRGGAAELWAAHRQHVAEVHQDADPLPVHARLEDAVVMYDAAQACRTRSAARSRLLAVGAALLVGVVLMALVAMLQVVLRPAPGWALLLAVPPALAVLLLHRPLWLRLRHWRRLHPLLRVPVPSAPAS
jgi:hypothetical protein